MSTKNKKSGSTKTKLKETDKTTKQHQHDIKRNFQCPLDMTTAKSKKKKRKLWKNKTIKIITQHILTYNTIYIPMLCTHTSTLGIILYDNKTLPKMEQFPI